MLTTHQSANGQYRETNFEREEDCSVMIMTFIKDHPTVVINVTGKAQKHPHLESLDTFYKIFSDTKGE